MAKYFLIILGITIVLLVGAYLSYFINRWFNANEELKKQAKEYTSYGSRYIHQSDNKSVENGNFIWMNISYEEIIPCWNRVSKIKLSNSDPANKNTLYALIRYVTSKGLTKDSVGFKELNIKDIESIEKGVCNYKFNEWTLPERYLYQFLWEIHEVSIGSNVSGYSFGQRILYFKAGFRIFSGNILFGVGIGDVKSEYENFYKQNSLNLTPENQRRGHNQFLAFAIGTGLVGLLLFVIIFFLLPVRYGLFKNPVFPAIYCITLVSMFIDDTLETQIGTYFIMFFYSLIWRMRQ